MKVKFRSIDAPAVAVEGHKFVGGRLEVDERDAPAIRAYAASHPRLGIREVRPPRPVEPPRAIRPKARAATRRPRATVVAVDPSPPAGPDAPVSEDLPDGSAPAGPEDAAGDGAQDQADAGLGLSRQDPAGDPSATAADDDLGR